MAPGAHPAPHGATSRGHSARPARLHLILSASQTAYGVRVPPVPHGNVSPAHHCPLAPYVTMWLVDPTANITCNVRGMTKNKLSC